MHLIIKGIDVVFTPKDSQWEKTWHGLETPLKGGIRQDGKNCEEVFCPLVECGVKADFEADIANVPEELIEFLGTNPLSQWKLILADCRKGIAKTVLPLHVPKAGYAKHQNRDLFDCMVKAAIEVLGVKGFEIVTLGTLGGYTQFFMSIAVKGHEGFNVGKLANKANDSWKQFFNLNSSHNGLIGSNRSLSMIRQVCWNTVNASIADAEQAGTISGIKHTKNSMELITPAQFAADLKTWLDNSKTFQALLAMTKEQAMNVDEFKAFAAGVFTNEASDELSTNSYNRIEEMTPLFQKGMGNRGVTRYDAINAFTEFFTSGAGVGNPANVKMNKRIATANFGRGNDWKLQAMKTATDETAFNAVMARGQILYADKAKVVATAN